VIGRACAVGVAAWVLGGAAAARGASVRITADQEPDAYQSVVDSAAPGDTVWVAPGQYRMLVVPSGVRVLSESGPSDTVFRNGSHFVFDASRTDSTTVIEGFTLDGIKAAEGVLVVSESQAVVRNCVIRNGWSGVRGVYAEVELEGCEISDCQNGVYLFESRGVVDGNTIRGCINGITLVSASPRIVRNEIRGNSLGISVSEHSDPRIGGSLRTANRVFDNPAGAVKNTALTKRAGLRTMKPYTLRVPYNFWGSNCPDSAAFRGPVEYEPWVDDSGERTLAACEDDTAP
jgi:parallel beta-helix repeat protein